MKVAANEVLLFTFHGNASLHKKGCSHLEKYSAFLADGSRRRVVRGKGMVVETDVQHDVDDLIERGYKVRRASCLRMPK